MRAFALVLSFGFAIAALVAHAQDNDSGISSIHKINIQDAPDPAADANYIGLDLDIKRLKVPGARANVILRQMTKRVRVEFEGAGVPKGKYALAVGNACPGHTVSEAHYKSAFTELHRFDVTTVTTQTEKSAPGAALRDGGKLILFGKHLAFFKVTKGNLELIDCREIK